MYGRVLRRRFVLGRLLFDVPYTLRHVSMIVIAMITMDRSARTVIGGSVYKYVYKNKRSSNGIMIKMTTKYIY